MPDHMLKNRLLRLRLAAAGVIAIGGIGLGAGIAGASDYYHICRTVDGQYMMNDGALQRAGQNGDGQGPEISYTTKKTVVLSERKGYCIGSNTGRRHQFAAKSYVLDISFRADGRKVETSMLCEMAADGLPAATNCTREVVTMNWAIRPQTPGGGSQIDNDNDNSPAVGGRPITGGTQWMHNGSVMRLKADGNARRIYYEVPRLSLRRRGVRSGELLFEGRRSGNTYEGTAYIFTKRCGKVAYQVAGTVQNNDRRVVMTGQAPRLNANCDKTGSKRDQLVFTLKR